MHRKWIRAALLATAASIGGCGGDSPSEPVVPFTLTVTSSITVPGRSLTVGGLPRYQCDYSFVATAKGGRAGEYAAWSSATIDFRLNSTGATSQLQHTATDLQDWFSSDRVSSGAVRSALRNLNWSSPFTAVVAFRYTIFHSDGSTENGTSSVPVACS